jgi:MFS transporter, AAHS family, cis,cis-muconate transporter
MKKLVLATLCGIASAQAFSAEASEDRMQFLESQLKQIQAELEQQKAAQLALKNQQEQAKAQDSKTLSSMVDNAGFTLGSLVITMISGWIIPEFGWRMLYWITIAPLALGILMHFMVPEPESWKRVREMKRTGQIVDNDTKKGNPYITILKDKTHGKMFILWSFSSGFLLFGYFGVSNWLPSYLEAELGIKFKEMALYMVGTFITMIFAKIIAGYVADKIGRRIVFAFGTMGTALFIPVVVYMHNADNIGVLMLIFGFLYGIPYAINATYLTESFPTGVRGTAVGGAFNIGRIGAIFAPITIGYLAMHGSIGTGLLVMGAAYFLCGLIPALFIKDRLYDPQKAE